MAVSGQRHQSDIPGKTLATSLISVTSQSAMLPSLILGLNQTSSLTSKTGRSTEGGGYNPVYLAAYLSRVYLKN